MLKLKRLNGEDFWINPDLLESMEAPGGETVLNLQDGNRLVVLDQPTEVMERFEAYQRRIRDFSIKDRSED